MRDERNAIRVEKKCITRSTGSDDHAADVGIILSEFASRLDPYPAPPVGNQLLTPLFLSCSALRMHEPFRALDLLNVMNDWQLMFQFSDFQPLLSQVRHLLYQGQSERHDARSALEMILANVPVATTLWESANGRFVVANSAAERLLGQSSGEISGKTLWEVFSSEQAERLHQQDQLAQAASEAPMILDEFPLQTADGERAVKTYRLPIHQKNDPDSHILMFLEDVTDQSRKSKELTDVKIFLDTVIENVPVSIFVQNVKDCRLAFVNRAGEELFGVPRRKLLGTSIEDVCPKETGEAVRAADRDMIANRLPQLHRKQKFQTPANGTRIVNAQRRPVISENGEMLYIISVFEDVTEYDHAEKRIAHLAHHDPLTDLPNRAAFNEYMAKTLEKASNDSSSFYVMLLDLDHFKEVNDVFGHAVGDALLCQVSSSMQRALKGAFLARLGGDEFAVVMSDDVASESSMPIPDKLLDMVSENFEVEGHKLRVGLSIGIAVFPNDGIEAATLLAHADAALYRAKSDGRSAIRYFDPGMDQSLRDRTALTRDFRSALQKGEISLHYQPQAQIDGKIIGFEALARWYHPVRGLVPPAVFIPLAEESSIIFDLGEWVLREACREAASWTTQLGIAVNLSPVQFRHGDLPALVHTVLLETGLAPSRLELEVTESVLIHDMRRAISILRRLKTLGVRIAMDDFGTGYSSLANLQAFAFDKIKIDRSFIMNLYKNPQASVITRAVIGLAHGLDVPVIAEGVETLEQMQFLSNESCNEVQGFRIGKPCPINEYAELVGRGRQDSARKMQRG